MQILLRENGETRRLPMRWSYLSFLVVRSTSVLIGFRFGFVSEKNQVRFDKILYIIRRDQLCLMGEAEC